MNETPVKQPRAVLVVDDNESTRYVLSHWLRRANFRVGEAASGAGAFSALASRRYDAVVLDVNLPDMTGLGVCAAIKADPAVSSLPVIHVSATAIDPTDRITGLRGGADAYLVEPLDREEFLATVEALLRLAEARQRAEALAGRLSLLHSASLELNAAQDAEELTSTAVRAASELCQGPAAVGASTETGGTLALFEPAGDAARISLSGEDLRMLAIEPSTVLSQLAPGRVLAGQSLSVFAARGRRMASSLILAELPTVGDPALETALHQLAQTVAVAAEHLQLLSREHGVAVTLQRGLLGQVPTVPWLDIAVRYIPSANQMEVGGDFYDVVRLDDERVAIVIGDVEGHSLHSATVMATLRNSLSAYLLAGRSPGVAIDLLEHVLAQVQPDMTATVCCVVLDRQGRATVANGGHIPPILKTTDGVEVVAARGTLLGVSGRRPELTFRLHPGDTLVQYTDGLVERRGHSITDGMAQAAAPVGDAPADVEVICDRMLQRFAPATTAADDIAIIAVRLGSPSAPTAG